MMPGKGRIDRTGHQYGPASVIHQDPQTPRLWVIRWGCCGAEQSVSVERCAYMSRRPPAMCLKCTQALASSSDDYAEPKRQQYLAKTPQENLPEDRPPAGIAIPGRGFWPFLNGPMGPRYSGGYRSAGDHS